jgi:hypothetical protein
MVIKSNGMNLLVLDGTFPYSARNIGAMKSVTEKVMYLCNSRDGSSTHS